MSSFRSDRVGRSGRSGGVGFAWRVGVLVGVAWLGWAGTSVHGQSPGRGGSKFYPDSSDTAETLLRNAANHARERQWSEAIEIYQRVIDQYGEKVAKLPRDEPGAEPSGEFILYVDGRQFCHRCLARLPAEARAVYRNRVDGLAEGWYRQGAARRDTGLLRRVIDRAFCSSWGDDALELLGDLAFLDGRFGEALAMYGRLVADRPDDPTVLVHPDPSVDLARVAAKTWLCRAAGENPPTKRDLEEFARRYAGAAGSLAGRKGSYATILAEALAADHLQPPAQPDSRWPTFAGSPRRSRVVPGPIDVGQVQWRVELEKVAAPRAPSGYVTRMSTPANPPASERLLAFHPIVLGDQVLVCDGARVLAYNLNDRPDGAEGTEARPVTPAWRHDPDNGAPIVQATRNPAAIPRYTLTAVGSRIYARMGFASSTAYSPMGRRFGPMPIGETGSSSIVALDWNTQGKLLWELKSANFELPDRPAGASRTVNFEGTPVADSRNVYVAVTDRREQTATYVAGLDAETGTRRWIRYLGTATPEFDHAGGFGMGMTWNISTPGDYHHRLLSFDGPTLYYQTNLGALIALDAETGATRWVATYPRKESNRFGPTTERDLNPAVVHEDRVIVAPSDADAIFAFDAASGRLLWRTEPISDDIKLTHLLGVAQGRLVATGDRVLLFDVQTGKLLSTWPDSANKSMEGYGRGLLAGDRIYWPTRTEIQVLDQRSGLLADRPIKLAETYRTTGGNLAAGDGYLVVAQADGLVVFCQNSRLIERYREEIVRAPEQASTHYRLARAAEAVGRDELSLASYRQAIAKARPSETVDGMPLAGTARDRMVRLLMRLAGQSRRDRHWEEALARLESAAEIARTDPERLESRLLLADVLLDAGRPRDALEALERLLSDGRLRPLPVATADGHRTIRADLLIADRLGAIVRQ
ncbi:MAG TPA: PQQ-binding-like beta-propeller repeat protein, partial [Isosphaeraceae bacterium]|nr:PQQ-binding-like beta-propeller repeat protein [Isosphaeraceae bacterium]